MTAPSAAAPTHLGFLTILNDAGGSCGGFLVTNLWGRPLEFRLSTAVQPNRVQQILYGGTLAEFLAADLIGKTLIEKTGTPSHLILTDSQEALSLRRLLDRPVIWIARPGDPRADELSAAGFGIRPAERGRGPLIAHPESGDDLPKLREFFEKLSGLDLVEPFVRIRDAVAEARRMGVTQRAG